MRELHLFAGAGGGILGGMLLGNTPVAAVEIEPYCQEVLRARQRDGVLPDFPIFGDIREFDGTPWRGKVDIVAGGFPCQAWSTAASGKNTAGTMWPEMLRVIGEICPYFIFAENVDEGAIIEAQSHLAEAGYYTERMELSADKCGADHPRKRWWVFAHTNHKSKLECNEYAEMAIQQTRSCGIWKTLPSKSRMANGVAHRMDRLKAIGNGQVPAVAATAFRILSEGLI